MSDDIETIYIYGQGDPSVGIPDPQWVIENAVQIDWFPEPESAREQIRNDVRELFEKWFADGAVQVVFGSELRAEIEEEQNGHA